MKTQTQRNKVLVHLNSGAALTPLEAQKRYGIGRLAARIKELRDQGFDIVDIRKEAGTRYSVYRLRTMDGQ
ncbi:MAG: helix-turn-helix domain-containing protein, partial [Candidatus Krumholzibacteriota bacterium]